jgi:Tripartite tricarboxylate transporter family receptor
VRPPTATRFYSLPHRMQSMRPSITQLQFHSRYLTDRRPHPLVECHGRSSIGSGQDGSEFIAHAKASPGKINMASVGNGTAAHVAGELFKMMSGTDLVHVPYRGAPPAMTDLLGGQVQVYC